MLWLWFGIPFVVSMFVIATPGTHVHIFFVPWMLVIGTAIEAGWERLNRRVGRPRAALWSAGVVAVAVAVFGAYSYMLFVYHDREILLEKGESWPRIYWLPPEAEDLHSFYGFPLSNGWKAVGALYSQGVLTGDYETNQTADWIPAWYTRGQRRCSDSAAWFFATDNPEPWFEPADDAGDRVMADGYQPWASVENHDQPRLAIYGKEGAPAPPGDRLDINSYGATFDATVTADFPLHYPVVQPQPAHLLDVNLDNRIVLEGYDLDVEEPLRPGDPVELVLYWRALAPLEQPLKVFVQAFYADGKMVLQRDNIPVCNRRPTQGWRPGERIVDWRTIEVAEDAPTGTYPLYVGMYFEETLERLPILDGAGNPQATEVWLDEITIENEPSTRNGQ